MKRFGLFVAICVFPVAALAIGMVISPVQLGLSGPPGSTVSGVINVSSSRPRENTIRVSFGDYVIDAEGKRTEVTSVNVPTRSCRAWLDVDQQQFVSPEQGKVPVVISARIPADASGSYWAEAYFESLPAPPSFTPGGRAPVVGLQIVPRIGIPIIVTAKGTEKYNVKIDGLGAARTADGVEASVQIENSGNAVVMISGAVALEKPAAGAEVPEELISKDIEPVTSYPGVKRNIKIALPLKPVDPASIDLHAYLRFGRSPDQALEASSKLRTLLENQKNGEMGRQ